MYHQPRGEVLPANEKVSGNTTVPHRPVMQSLMAAGGHQFLLAPKLVAAF